MIWILNYPWKQKAVQKLTIKSQKGRFKWFSIATSFCLRTFSFGILSFYVWSLYEFGQLLISATLYKKFELSWNTSWILLDIAFIILIESRFRYGQPKSNTYLPIASQEIINDLMEELEDERSVGCMIDYMEKWFFDHPIEDLKRGDIIEWSACMLFNTTVPEITQEQLEVIESMITRLEKNVNLKLAETSSRQAKKMLLTVDPVEIFHRPLIFYASIKTVTFFTGCALWKAGFEQTNDKGIITYIKRGTSNEPPIVFFHGIGIGLSPYLRFIYSIMERFPDRTIILFEKGAISMQLASHYLLPEQYAKKVHEKIRAEGIDQIVVVGHSLGTMVICWLDYFYPDLIQSRLFLDPVCFALWTSDIARNFMYRSPDNMKHYVLKYVASMEPGISLYLRRYFV